MIEFDAPAIRALFAPLLVKLYRLREQWLDSGVVWILPTDLLVGCVAIYGVDVIHADVPAPMLGLGA